MTIRNLLTLSAAALTLAGCMKAADTQAADAATAQFYKEVGAKQYQAIYDNAASELKLSMPAGTFVGMMQQVDDVMGACAPPKKRLSFHININGNGTFRTQGYTRTCAKGPLNESVTMVIRGGEAKLAGYHFGPDADRTSGNDD